MPKDAGLKFELKFEKAYEVGTPQYILHNEIKEAQRSLDQTIQNRNNYLSQVAAFDEKINEYSDKISKNRRAIAILDASEK